MEVDTHCEQALYKSLALEWTSRGACGEDVEKDDSLPLPDRYKSLFLKRIIYGAESSESLVISSFDFPWFPGAFGC